MLKPIKSVVGRNLHYLYALAEGYKELGYTIQMVSHENRLNVYDKGTDPRDIEVILETWID